jgi:hypothetical protein
LSHKLKNIQVKHFDEWCEDYNMYFFGFFYLFFIYFYLFYL